MNPTTHAEYVSAVNQAKYANYRYFVLSSPTMSDAEFDDLYFSIRDYEASHPEETLPDSPTQVPGSDLRTSSHSVPHRYPMLSTEKFKTAEDVEKWMNKALKAANNIWLKKLGKHISEEHSAFAVEWKYDGISCSLVYQDGILIEASTRGDTKKNLGQDILSHVLRIPNVPHGIYNGHRVGSGVWVQSGSRVPGRVEVRGEILLPYPIYNDNAMLQHLYGDTRTAASSILNTDGESPYDDQLRFSAWQLIVDEWGHFDADANPTLGHTFKHSDSIDILYDKLGFDTAGYEICYPVGQPNPDIKKIIANMTEMRSSLAFPTDGIVIKLDDKRLWHHMGHTDHHHKFECAYKFPPTTAVTTCINIDYTIGGKTGKITPVAYFNPVTINGKEFSKASLGSEKCMNELGIKVGSRIEVALANDVIPHVNRVIE